MIKKAAINIANNLVQHEKAKHIEIYRHFINEKLSSRQFVTSEGQPASIFTKDLNSKSFHNCICKKDMRNIYTPS